MRAASSHVAQSSAHVNLVNLVNIVNQVPPSADWDSPEAVEARRAHLLRMDRRNRPLDKRFKQMTVQDLLCTERITHSSIDVLDSRRLRFGFR
jgi:hypothetical protein